MQQLHIYHTGRYKLNIYKAMGDTQAVLMENINNSEDKIDPIEENWIKLDKYILMALICQTSPYYSIFENSLISKCGEYIGGFKDEWIWHKNELIKLTETDLINLYNLCIDSWNNISNK